MNVMTERPTTLAALRAGGWKSRTVKQEIRENFLRQLQGGAHLYPGIVGYDNTVIPEINLALIAGHDMLFLGEKGQAKSRLMRSLVRFLDDARLPGPRRPLEACGGSCGRGLDWCMEERKSTHVEERDAELGGRSHPGHIDDMRIDCDCEVDEQRAYLNAV